MVKNKKKIHFGKITFVKGIIETKLSEKEKNI